ncbi:MAG: TIGR03960 family B12-binding radical SAM protein [Clostridiales bacterium]|nr:TIGR03960 family B12-binding radical SAM protein [Clostridiales bacterium]
MDTHNVQRLEALLETVQRPSRYTGGEVNAIVKEWKEGRTTFCFAFPDTYEVAMSHLGMKVIYAAVNREDDLLCERAMMPWVDLLEGLKKEKLPLFSLESRRALSDFDCVGFTLQYEMSYTNILTMLDLGGIALESKNRAEDAPIVIAGGPCAFNPEPLHSVIDAFLLGDGETATGELLRAIGKGRKEGKTRLEILRDLAKIEGVYVPALYEIIYKEDGTLASVTPSLPEARKPIKKRLELDLDAAFFPGETPLPFTEAVHDRIVLEVMRGCTRGCRFCQAGMLYRPVRERSVEKLVELAQSLFQSTGYEEMSLSSLSTGDYTQLLPLISSLNQNFEGKMVSLSLPSLRIDNQLQDALVDTAKVKKSGLTLAPEAGTQRLRDVINKGVTEEDLMRSVSEAFEAGWSQVKLYFMIGLPTETDEDLLGIADLARKVVGAYFALPKEKRAKGLKVVVSASTFVPKPFTPFQWAAQDTLEEIKRKQSLLRSALNIRGVTFNWHDPETSFLEACFARGDRKLAMVLLRAYELGCKLDGWNEHFKYDAWMQAFSDTGVDPAFYANRVREKSELLPWEIADIGVTKAYLWLENERALRGDITPDCRAGCEGCGLRRFDGVCPV